MASVQSIISLLSQLAPQRFACDWDNAGIQVGDFTQEIEKVLFTLDITKEVIEEAINIKADMILSHHPLIFNGLNSVHNQTRTGEIIIKAIQNNLVLYSAHTNLDIAPNGLNDYLAELFTVNNTSPLDITNSETLYKLVVFIPEDYFPEVRKTILDNGAGHIGNYSHTSFSTAGEGTFKPLTGSKPFKGEKGNFNEVEELKLETIIPENRVNKVIRAMLKVHPYEEVAYDIYSLNKKENKFGLGRIGYLDEKIKLGQFLKKVKRLLNLEVVKFVGTKDKIIKKVAICSGSGGDLIKKAKAAGADLYITGDIKYHQAQLAEEQGLALLDAGHYETESIVKELFAQYFLEKSDLVELEVEFVKSRINTNPWQQY